MIIVVTGGRDYTNYPAVEAELDWWNQEPHGPISTLVHGGARGADSLADQWAALRGVPRVVYFPEWDRLCKAAGMIRNRTMLDASKPDLVVAFPGGRGTAGCVMEARRRGIEVREVVG
jgi:hypothetical protein